MLSYITDLDKRMFYRIVDLSQRHGVYAWAKRISATGDGHVYLYLCWVDADTLPRAEPVQSAVGEFFD